MPGFVPQGYGFRSFRDFVMDLVPDARVVIHHADVLAIEGESYRLREAEKRAGKARQANGA